MHDAAVDVGADNVPSGVKVPPPAKCDFLCYLESRDPTSIDSIIIVVLYISLAGVLPLVTRDLVGLPSSSSSNSSSPRIFLQVFFALRHAFNTLLDPVKLKRWDTTMHSCKQMFNGPRELADSFDSHLLYTIPPAGILCACYYPLCTRIDLYKILFLITASALHALDVLTY